METDQESIDWSSLHSDLLHFISQKLPDICNLIRFRLVCKRWRDAVPRFDLSPRFPWIMQYRHSLCEPDLHFYSPYSNKIHTFHFGEQKSGNCTSMGSSAKDKSQNQYYIMNHFLNAPLLQMNRSHIIIPPPSHGWYRNEKYYYENSSVYPQSEYWIFQDNILYYYKCGQLDETKDWIFKGKSYDGNGCAYFKGRYFTDSQNEGTNIVDINSCEELFTLPPVGTANSNRGFSCLIESKNGDLFKVFRPYDINLDLEETYFEIYRLVLNNNEQPFWVEVKNIKDEIFFLDYSCQGLALNARDFVGLRGNCIYFLKGEFSAHQEEISENEEENLENEEEISENEKENPENDEKISENEEENSENEEEISENEDEKELGFILCIYDLADRKIVKLKYPFNIILSSLLFSRFICSTDEKSA